MRSLLFATIFASAACTPVDHFIGQYTVTVTGSDMQTAPTASTMPVGGTGFVTINVSKEDTKKYFVNFGQDGYLCRAVATKGAEALELVLADGQTCVVGNFTFVTTDGKVTLDKETLSTVTVNISYTYSGQVVFNFSGTGTRTYAGAKQ